MRTPTYELITQGTMPDSQMMKTLPGMPIPYQKMVSGIQATGGIGRIISKIGRASPSASTNQPISRPSGMPTASARRNPVRASMMLM